MANRKVLVVDDDKEICELLRDILKENGLQAYITHTTEEAWDKVTQVAPDIILLDFEVPLKGGLEFCRELKESKSHCQIPIIFLTVRGRDMDKVAAFNLGGDDFITKPFSPKELIARVHVALRRSAVLKLPANAMRSGSLFVDFDRRVVMIENKEVSFSPKEFDIIKLLYTNRHQVVSDKQIFEQVWGPESRSMLSTVYTHINRLRKKMAEHAVKIRTVPGVGFRFDERKEDNRK